MESDRIRRVAAREGYDLWAESYDTTPNPVVAMDARHSVRLLAPGAGERILDAGCGTGRNLKLAAAAGARAVGMDFSAGMLAVARPAVPGVPLVRADLHAALPFRDQSFDAVLCALIGEHLEDLGHCFREFHRVLRSGGRLVFTVYHPDLAAAGKEANFVRDGVEYRLGAVRYSVSDYLGLLRDSGFEGVEQEEFDGDEEAANLAGRKVLLALRAARGR